MNQIGRKIYFEVATGNVILDTGERQGAVVKSTVEQDIATFKVLSERNRETFDVIELKYGQYSQDFAVCVDYRVNVETRQIVFSYSNLSRLPEEKEPDYSTPLSEQVAELKKSVLEMTTLTALQNEKFAKQNKAILELTTLIAGGNA